MKRIILFYLFLYAGLSLFSEDHNEIDKDEEIDLVYLAEELRPYNFSEEGDFKGISVELLNLIWEKLGYKKSPIKILPWARAYYYLQTNEKTVLLTTSRTEERENLFQWVGPIYSSQMVLISLKSNNIIFNGIEDLGKFNLGTVRDDVSEQLLLKEDLILSQIHRVDTMDQNLKMLHMGRVDLIPYALETFEKFVENNNYSINDYSIVHVYNQTSTYFAFSRDIPRTIINNFQIAFDSLEKEVFLLVKKYLN